MLAKYRLEYAMHLGRNAHVNHYQTDDPVAAEEFLVHILEHGYAFRALRHEGVELPRPESDKMLKTAAGVLASRSPSGARTAKRVIYGGLATTLAEGLKLEAAALREILTSADYAEGLAAFAERRPPRFGASAVK